MYSTASASAITSGSATKAKPYRISRSVVFEWYRAAPFHACGLLPLKAGRVAALAGRRVEQVAGGRCPRCRRFQAEMQIGRARDDPAARRAHHVALLDQIGFQHILDGAALLADGGRQVVDSDRAAVELLDDGQQQAAVLLVEAVDV